MHPLDIGVAIVIGDDAHVKFHNGLTLVFSGEASGDVELRYIRKVVAAAKKNAFAPGYDAAILGQHWDKASNWVRTHCNDADVKHIVALHDPPREASAQPASVERITEKNGVVTVHFLGRSQPKLVFTPFRNAGGEIAGIQSYGLTIRGNETLCVINSQHQHPVVAPRGVVQQERGVTRELISEYVGAAYVFAHTNQRRFPAAWTTMQHVNREIPDLATPGLLEFRFES